MVCSHTFLYRNVDLEHNPAAPVAAKQPVTPLWRECIPHLHASQLLTMTYSRRFLFQVTDPEHHPAPQFAAGPQAPKLFPVDDVDELCSS